MAEMAADIVLEWDVHDGGLLGAVIRCPDCPNCLPPSAVEGSGGTGCEGAGRLFRAYLLHGRSIDLHRDAEILVQLLDRKPYHEPEIPSTVHRCPLPGQGVTLCCGRVPFELPRYDRMTADPAMVSCVPSDEEGPTDG